MKPTCLLLSSFQSGNNKSVQLLLPNPSIYETGIAAMKGAWAQVVDQDARDSFEQLSSDGVIRESVLQNASNGSTLTFALFNNLQDPIWKKHNFKAKEFVQAVGPALENVHEILGKIRNEMITTVPGEKAAIESTLKHSVEEILANQVSIGHEPETLLGKNELHVQAKENPNSLAAWATKILTPACLEAFYYTSKFDLLSALPKSHKVFEEGSCNISEVAILNARAMAVTDKTSSESAPVIKQRGVAAQIDVLYEVSHTFNETNMILHDDPNKDASESCSDPENKSSPELASEEESVPESLIHTNLTVAVFEGWLHGGPDNILKWRIAGFRQPFEFPFSPPTINGKGSV
jgi:hypothetical protein